MTVADRPRVVVVGGGIAGLVAARDLARAGGAEVVLLDASDRVGGKLRLEDVAGHRVDVGAESLLARRPEGLDLLADLGLDADVVHPASGGASVWSRGRLHPLPSGTLMGIPGDPARAAGLLTDAEVERAADERAWPGGGGAGVVGEDVSVGDYVAGRLGDAVVDRLVEPLLGGVYAGHARRLSLRAALPQVWSVAAGGGSLLEAAREAGLRAGDGERRPPVFASLRGGLGRLPEVLAADLARLGATVRSRTIARELAPGPRGWAVTVGPTRDPERIDADAVVLAVPARPAARLLAGHTAAADLLADIEYASMAVVTLAVPADRLPALPGSGFLVPPVEGRTIKASTFSSAKWPALAQAAPGVAYLRASVGRAGEESDLQRPDADLVRVAAAEVGEALGRPLPELLDAHVQRWGGALPQYAVGHVARVARVRAELAGLTGLALAGAAYDGVGVPAVVGTARTAAARVLTHLRTGARTGGQ